MSPEMKISVGEEETSKSKCVQEIAASSIIIAQAPTSKKHGFKSILASCCMTLDNSPHFSLHPIVCICEWGIIVTPSSWDYCLIAI